jgi:hypothetical protein
MLLPITHQARKPSTAPTLACTNARFSHAIITAQHKANLPEDAIKGAGARNSLDPLARADPSCYAGRP